MINSRNLIYTNILDLTDFKSIWLAHSPQPQTFEDLEQLVTEGIDYFTHSFISGKRNDLTAAEYRFGKAN
ncbi:hypothetical protein AN630_00975 [Limosilactobacillus fermentum]|nr:hypothetical protein AN630_00975 [Limosilactobacillus fermentum]